jgi:hypothetical protein
MASPACGQVLGPEGAFSCRFFHVGSEKTVFKTPALTLF